MLLSQHLPNNKLLFDDPDNTFVVFKIDTADNEDLVNVSDFTELIKKNHELLHFLETVIENRFNENMFDRERNRIRKPINPRSSCIKLGRVSKQSPTVFELVVRGIQLGYGIAELLNDLLQKGANSDEFKQLLLRYHIQPELIDAIANDLNRLVTYLRPINKAITIYYGTQLFR
jgi:hypothetical protein